VNPRPKSLKPQPLKPWDTSNMAMIEVSHVTKQFKQLTAVDDISFSVKAGELFALLGPNGAGKSTTIKMLTTLLRPTKGSLTINGHGIPLKDARQRIEELLNLVELWERRDSMVKTFSGGMKRRLEIARGLLHHPKLLFLDEPTLGLDTQTRNLLWAYVQRLVKEENMTVLFTTHYLEEAEANADRIAIIDHGKLLVIGTSKQLEKQTKTNSLEEAYLKLTGAGTRDSEAGAQNTWAERHRSRAMR
jgi:ABC-2 type transport system ATP-binding protein